MSLVTVSWLSNRFALVSYGSVGVIVLASLFLCNRPGAVLPSRIHIPSPHSCIFCQDSASRSRKSIAMRSSQLFVLASAIATAAATIFPESATTNAGVSTTQHVFVGTESGLPHTEDVVIPTVSASITPSSGWTSSEAQTATESGSDDSSASSASTTSVTRPAGFPNATSKKQFLSSRVEPCQANVDEATLASSLVPTKSQNTTTPTSHVTGGAIPQQMQSSMAGLIGFCIMGLIML